MHRAAAHLSSALLQGRRGAALSRRSYAYWIVRVDVHDADSYARYAALAGPAVKAAGGEFLVRGGEATSKEGAARARNVVVRWPDMAAAEACYTSAPYRAALAHGVFPAATRDFLIVDGV
ncbi:hypothetical protein M885DRAFT_619310 [Pelagophyceae sp. CCMP2097]|nr:hypothetical protein M885DRAFT_619310 [Pelagophyceae sp. CCMP2097]